MTSDREWTERTLCDDGSCTGVIGGDGTCRVCGRASRYWGDERRRGLKPPADVDAADDNDEDDEAPSDQGPGAGDDDRALCVDGSCVGLIGANGKCKVCGLPGPTRRPARAKPARAKPVGAKPAAVGAAAVAGDAASADGGDTASADGGDTASADGGDTASADGGDAGDHDVDDGDVHADDDAGEEDDDADPDDDPDDDAGDDDAGDDDRKLCPDGGCVGVLDANGICKICGRSDAEN